MLKSNYVDFFIIHLIFLLSFIGEQEQEKNVKGFSLLKNHIKAMFLKLAYNAMRNKIIALIQLITPLINISISVLISRSWKFMSSLPPLVLSLESGFKKTETLMSELAGLKDNSLERLALLSYKNYFKSKKDYSMKLTDFGTSPIDKMYLKMVCKNFFGLEKILRT